MTTELYYFDFVDNMIDVLELLTDKYPVTHMFTRDPHFVYITCPAYRRDEIDDVIILFTEQR